MKARCLRTDRALTAFYGDAPATVRHRLRARRRRDRRHHRRQRRRLEHLHEGSDRAHQGSARADPLRGRGDRRPRAGADRAPRHRARARRASGACSRACRSRKSTCRWAASPRERRGPWSLGRLYRLFPALEEKREQPEHAAVRRPAADGGDRPRPDEQPPRPPLRRAEPRPRAHRRQGDLRRAARRCAGHDLAIVEQGKLALAQRVSQRTYCFQEGASPCTAPRRP